MSLARLLTAAKALTKFNEPPSAYRMRRSAMLPKFCLMSDPFAPDKKTDATSAEAKSVAAPAAAGGVLRSLLPWKKRGDKQEAAVGAKSPFQAKSGSRKADRTPVQCELLLENVRVVRNNLLDSDVDVVLRRGEKGSAQPVVAANLMLPALAAQKALDRLADRIVGAETQ